jgi:hypothetical protein
MINTIKTGAYYFQTEPFPNHWSFSSHLCTSQIICPPAPNAPSATNVAPEATHQHLATDFGGVGDFMKEHGNLTVENRGLTMENRDFSLETWDLTRKNKEV